MLTTNPVREALLSCRPTLGSWIQIGHPVSAEILANAGFDWLAIDCEHTDIDVAEATSLMRAMSRTSCLPIVRVAENNTLQIRRLLDAGARGIIVPMVNSAEQARRAVAAAKYPPTGVRGFGFCRANDHGCAFNDYVQHANDDILVVAQIEHINAVDCIDDILAVEGVDGVFIGPYDLSGSLDITGELGHPKMQEAMSRLHAACKSAGKAAGLHVVAPEANAIQKALADGFTFLALSVDIVFMNHSARHCLQTARAALKPS